MKVNNESKHSKALLMALIFRIMMNVLPEKQKEVLLTLLSLIEPAGMEQGCLSYGVFRDIRDKNIFNLISEWQDRQYLNLHLQSDRVTVLLGTKSLLSEPMKIQIVTASGIEGLEAVNAERKNRRDLTI